MSASVVQLCNVLREHLEAAELQCHRCHVLLALACDKVLMTETAMETTFVNPHGTTHGLTCVSRLRAEVFYEGPPSTEFSWFPGYAWQIMRCNTCASHLGWRFSAAHAGHRKRTSSSCSVREFWGLTQSAFTMYCARSTRAAAVEEEFDGAVVATGY